ncbi:hypothetical protein D3C77_727120 [compost metagenome]
MERKEQGYLVKISNVSAAKFILQKAMEESEVEHFEIKEPTLNQIFIKEVGESNE